MPYENACHKITEDRKQTKLYSKGRKTINNMSAKLLTYANMQALSHFCYVFGTYDCKQLMEIACASGTV